MGHFTHNCKLTGLPITGGTKVVLFPIKMRKDLYENSEKNLRKYGSTYMCSNDGAWLKFHPFCFPIKGVYDDYGGIEDIVKDDNTEVLEKYFGMEIQTICDIITSGRKDDSYDSNLKPLLKEKPPIKGKKEGEKHFDFYQRIKKDPMPFGNGVYPQGNSDGTYTVFREGSKKKHKDGTKEEYDANFKLIHEQYQRYKDWCVEVPDPEDEEYNNPQYKDEHLELLSLSGMWIHGDVYEKLTSEPSSGYDGFSNRLDLGVPAILESLGFVEIERGDDERYKRRFKKDDLIINSDGTWINVLDSNGIYSFKDLKKYCEKKGVVIDISEHIQKDSVEQLYDYLIPKYTGFSSPDEDYPMLRWMTTDNNQKLIARRLLEIDSEYSNSYKPLTFAYFKTTKEGKLKQNMVEFWRFDRMMYNNGRFYDVVGTAPQDGSHHSVKRTLEVALDIINKKIEEYGWDEDDDED